MPGRYLIRDLEHPGHVAAPRIRHPLLQHDHQGHLADRPIRLAPLAPEPHRGLQPTQHLRRATDAAGRGAGWMGSRLRIAGCKEAAAESPEFTGSTGKLLKAWQVEPGVFGSSGHRQVFRKDGCKFGSGMSPLDCEFCFLHAARLKYTALSSDLRINICSARRHPHVLSELTSRTHL